MNTLWLDEAYLRQIAYKLPRFKQRSIHLYNARCILCGDSEKKKNKARWFAFEHKGALMVKCHNCGYNNSFGAFLYKVEPTLHKQYSLDKFREQGNTGPVSRAVPSPEFKMAAPEFAKPSPLAAIKKLSAIREDHPVLAYVNRRMIPVEMHEHLYYAPKFMTWVNSFMPGKFPPFEKDEPRLVIPLKSESGKLLGIVGRALIKTSQRFFTILLEEDNDKIFGLDRVDPSKTVYVTEGPIDAMFIPNGIAVLGGEINKFLRYDDRVILIDNEPRNPHVVKKVKSCIDKGLKVCIWPPDMAKRGKDINDFVLSGLTLNELMSIIKSNTYEGLKANLAFQAWCRT